MKLHSDRQIVITHDAIAKILGLYSISDFTFIPINIGIENTSVCINTDGKKYILRIYAYNKRPDEKIYLELEFQDYLRANGIPIPHIYPTKENSELAIVEIEAKRWQVILMEFLEGESVTENPSRLLIIELARIQARMHLLGVEFAHESNRFKNPLTQLDGSLADKLIDLPVKTKEVLGFIERVKSYVYPFDPDLPYGYNHTDIDFDGNVITRKDTITGIIDFDDMAYCPSILCLGFTLWNILDDYGVDEYKLYLDEYQKIRPLIDREQQALPHVIFFRNYEIGIIRLLLWEKDTPLEDITDIIKLEKNIPALLNHGKLI